MILYGTRGTFGLGSALPSPPRTAKLSSLPLQFAYMAGPLQWNTGSLAQHIVELTDGTYETDSDEDKERILEEYLESHLDDVKALRSSFEIKTSEREWRPLKARHQHYSGDVELAKLRFEEILFGENLIKLDSQFEFDEAVIWNLNDAKAVVSTADISVIAVTSTPASSASTLSSTSSKISSDDVFMQNFLQGSEEGEKGYISCGTASRILLKAEELIDPSEHLMHAYNTWSAGYGQSRSGYVSASDMEEVPNLLDKMPFPCLWLVVMFVHHQWNLMNYGHVQKNVLELARDFWLSPRHISDLATLVVAYGVSINLVGISWKSHPFILHKFGWGIAAASTTTVLLVTGIVFFSLVLSSGLLGHLLSTLGLTPLVAVLYVGAVQNIFSRSTKYCLCEPCNEMAHILLYEETKIEGKEIIEFPNPENPKLPGLYGISSVNGACPSDAGTFKLWLKPLLIASVALVLLLGSSLNASIDPAQVTSVVTESGKEIIELGFVLASIGIGLGMGGDGGEGKEGIPIGDDGGTRGREDGVPATEIVNHGVESGATLTAFFDDEA
ncbi:hypothetical protein NE237_021514 [Protea cynaroides]|uniref:ADP,ATP carrier protein n=1 Tax=Protea cynaroides TaxID=273540 RepID=A0A9Q0H984_9MAGN|nr:hypothetical protein NE237_021514 [Protea cynaroides]